MWGEVWYGCVLSSLTVKSISIFIACFSHWLHWVLPVAKGRCHQIQDNFHHAFWPLSKMPSSWWVCGGGQVTACLPVCSWALFASSHARESCFFNIYAWFFKIYFCFLTSVSSPQLTEFIIFTMNRLGCSIPFLQCFLSIVLQQMLEFTYSYSYTYS